MNVRENSEIEKHEEAEDDLSNRCEAAWRDEVLVNDCMPDGARECEKEMRVENGQEAGKAASVYGKRNYAVKVSD